jgi:hypothetical protein
LQKRAVMIVNGRKLNHIFAEKKPKQKYFPAKYSSLN